MFADTSIGVGTHQTFFACWVTETSLSVLAITTMRQPHGNALLTSLICGAMARAADTKVATREQRLPTGGSRSGHGSGTFVTFTPTSTDQKSAAPKDALALLRLLAR